MVDLRHDHEREPEPGPRPAGVATVRLPLDDLGDTEFWTRWGAGLDCTPLYYRAFLDRFPRRIARVAAAVADAPAGGVLVHCASGRDRTGLVALVLLAAEAIAADYLLSAERLAPVWTGAGLDGDQVRRLRLRMRGSG